jgi:hypothetical protein
MSPRIILLILTVWLAGNPANACQVAHSRHGCTAAVPPGSLAGEENVQADAGLANQRVLQVPAHVAVSEDWANAVRQGIIRLATTSGSTLLSAATAGYLAREREPATQASRRRAYVLAHAQAQKQLLRGVATTPCSVGSGVLWSVRDHGSPEHTVTVVVAFSAEIGAAAHRARAAAFGSEDEDADFVQNRLIDDVEASSLAPMGVRLFMDTDTDVVTIAGFGSAILQEHADAGVARQLRKAAEQQAQLRAKWELAAFLEGEPTRRGGGYAHAEFDRPVQQAFVPPGVRTLVVSGPERHWVYAISVYSAKMPQVPDHCSYRP